ncbi:redoxin domain-containing protein [Streptomyces sp. ACA25]|uniref:redoxin domain-containing protein n=1 Tax=Streptomyces sp. ACA25 TaxID=3022596 RepID=UPI0023078DEB|nr:redoxin domain-containing protein [Streptomyces sp. ACA25]MDB1086786.1 redoxin domain-containing protein [Streptomyces sp. ACA25]
MPMRSLPLRAAAAAAIAVALVALTACGGAGDDGASDAAAPSGDATGPDDPDDGGADDGSPDGDGADGDGADPDIPAALNFRTSTVDGGSFEGASLAGESAVLWFWAYNCPVCQAEAPGIKAAHEQWGEEVTFVGVPGNGSPEQDGDFVNDYGLDGFTHARDEDGALWTSFGVPAQPAFAFVDPDGNVDIELGTMNEGDLDERLAELAGAAASGR